MSIRDLLPEYALGLLPAEDHARVRAAVAASPELAAELAEIEETSAQLAMALPAEKPSAELWTRIEAGLSPRPFADLAARLAAALEVGLSAVHAMLDRIDLATSWVAGPSADARLYHIEPGPLVLAGGGLAGFVKVAPGGRFPAHRHDGDEQVIVLAGGFRDDDGTIFRAGDESRKPAGSSHGFVALPDEELIYLAVLRGGGVDFGDGFQL